MKTRQLQAENIKRIRQELRMSQEEFGFEIGYDQAFLSKVERGLKCAPMKLLNAISKRFGILE
jgi:DNA-binding transcriptional regulator YiaG